VPDSSGLVVHGDAFTVAGPEPVWHVTAGWTARLEAGATGPLARLRR
jgi:hypothetical protein